jgi:hypothetical protein
VANRALDFSGNFGFSSEGGLDGNRHMTYGGAGAWDRFGRIAVLGEYEWQPQGATLSYKQAQSLIGFGGRYYVTESKRLPVYVVAAGGYDHALLDGVGTGQNKNSNGGYIGFGGGVSMYLTENLGVRPEVRYQYEGVGTTGGGFNSVTGTVSVFFQLGGEAKK